MLTRVSSENPLSFPRVRSEMRVWDTFSRFAAPAYVKPSFWINLRRAVISSGGMAALGVLTDDFLAQLAGKDDLYPNVGTPVRGCGKA
jgi:hypothetical protein